MTRVWTRKYFPDKLSFKTWRSCLRFIAVTQPISYAKHKNNRRIWLTIMVVWLISVAIGTPIVLGLNNTPDRIPDLCVFYNSDFIIYSSLSSFYIPCIIMVYLYYSIFKVSMSTKILLLRSVLRERNVGICVELWQYEAERYGILLCTLMTVKTLKVTKSYPKGWDFLKLVSKYCYTSYVYFALDVYILKFCLASYLICVMKSVLRLNSLHQGY